LVGGCSDGKSHAAIFGLPKKTNREDEENNTNEEECDCSFDSCRCHAGERPRSIRTGQPQFDRHRPGRSAVAIAANLPLTDAEAVKFWPVYDQYQAEITKIGDTRFALIKEYATNYNTLTDTQAHDLVTRMIGVDESLVQLRQKYIPIVEKVLPGKKTAMFFQMDRRVALMIDLQLASMIPIVQP
jgi:hypothetical protein